MYHTQKWGDIKNIFIYHGLLGALGIPSSSVHILYCSSPHLAWFLPRPCSSTKADARCSNGCRTALKNRLPEAKEEFCKMCFGLGMAAG